MNIGTFYSNDNPLVTDLVANQTGTHTLEVNVQGTSVKTEDFEATSGNPIQLPNIFREYGLQEFVIKQPDGTDYPSTDECEMVLMMLLQCG